MRRKTPPMNREVREIPQRELRNQVSRVLAEVEQGARFRVTVSGRTVAELVPANDRRVWVPRERLVEILRTAPTDAHLLRDVDRAVDQSTDTR